MFAVMFATYGIAMTVAAVFVIESRTATPVCRFNPLAAGCFSGGDVIRTFMAVLIGSFALGQAGPNLAAAASAQAAAAPIFAVIDEVPAIDVEAEGGYAPPHGELRGEIEYRKVTFRYPSRPDEVVLRDFSLRVAPGARARRA